MNVSYLWEFLPKDLAFLSLHTNIILIVRFKDSPVIEDFEHLPSYQARKKLLSVELISSML